MLRQSVYAVWAVLGVVTMTAPASPPIALACFAVAVALAVMVVMRFGRRGWALTAEGDGIVVRGLIRTRVVPWAALWSVSVSPKHEDRLHVRRLCLVFQENGRWRQAEVGEWTRDEPAAAAGASLWGSVPAQMRSRIGFYRGWPVRPRPAAAIEDGVTRLRAAVVDPRWGELTGRATFGPDGVKLTFADGGKARSWLGARIRSVDLGTDAGAPERVTIHLECPGGTDVELSVDRADAATALALDRRPGSPDSGSGVTGLRTG